MRSPKAALAFLLALALGLGCRCGAPPVLGGVELGFRVSGDTVDFGRVLEGAQVLRQVTLFSESRAETAVAVSTEGPFAAAAEVLVPPGSSVDVAVTFTAGNARELGALVLSANGKSVKVPLVGEGVRPLPCVASAPCRTSRFDLDTGRCVEADSPEGARCTPADECLENGTCRSGQCLGTPRTCDDQNKCTSDACAKGLGCVHTPVVCPTPTAACRVATCDPLAGCGEGPAPDEFVCGSVDCKISNLCISGVCKPLKTVDGVRCSLPTPCQGAGACRNEVCVRPDAGELVPDYALSLPFAPVGALPREPVLLAHQSNLFWQTCGDGGVDAGCFLSSFTGTGFQRFFASLEDAGASASALVQVGDGGVVLLSEDGLRVLHVGSGQALASLPFSALSPPDAGLDGGRYLPRSAADRVARAANGELFAAVDWYWLPGGADAGEDGGEPDAGPPRFAGQTLVGYSVDGGRQEWSLPRREARLAFDVEGGLQLLGPEGDRAMLERADGGLVLRVWPELDGGGVVPHLLTAGARVLYGGRYLFALDGGAVADLGVVDGGLYLPLPLYSVATRSELTLFERRCLPEAQSCPPELLTPFARGLDLRTGAPLWEGQVAVYPGGTLLESAAGDSSAVLALTDETADGGSTAFVSLLLNGRRAYACPLPPQGKVGGAVFSRGFLYVLIERGGQWRLEAYDLQGSPISGAGWPQRFGVSGQRRAQP